MDGVIADVYAQFYDWDEREFGRRRSPDEVNGKREFEAFPHTRQYVFQDRFFRDCPLVDGCQPVVQQLNDEYELFIVSAAMEFPQSLGEKREWLAEHFPFLDWQQFVFCGSKQIIRADIMIDDHFKNLDHFSGQKILFTQPHNMFQDENGCTRVRSWKEIADLLLDN